ncbi:MAG TPA: NADH-quinone oxidoreductase subunit M [Myxococcaceae bacterium]|nr:NADH-quinone oxidoreductase subunit M [Myxococcaceae bacterium]
MVSALSPWLVTLVIFQPVVSAVLVGLLPQNEKRLVRGWTFLAMLLNFGLTVLLYSAFDPKGPEFQLEQRAQWISDLGISYHVGVDGLAVSLMLLTGFLGPLVVLCSWSFIEKGVKSFHLSLLLIQSAMLGALASLDVILFYVFFEAMLVPMYLIIGVWGSEKRIAAALKFFLYTLAGSLVMLVAILAVYFLAQPAGARSFDYAAFYNSLAPANRELAACVSKNLAESCATLSPVAQVLRAYGPWMFLAFAVAFAIKVPMFPVHTWLPDAHTEAPVAGSVILAGVMLKMGTFGFWRYAIPLFPVAAQQMRGVFAILATVGIVYGAMMCLAQRDVKRLIAYSSVSHLGFCMLGIFALTAEGAAGSAYQMLNHGVSTGALFALFGFLYERRHTRNIIDFGGIARSMPVFAALFLIITFSSIAVPGTNGFVGEFLVLLGTFKSTQVSMWIGVLAATGVILGASYMLWMAQRVFFGPLVQVENARLHDVNGRELAIALPFVVMVLVMGVLPSFFLDRLQTSTQRYVARAQVGAAQPVRDEDTRVTVIPLPSPAPVASLPADASARR